jgi:HAD superfamily hydrolase (TIGR01459 family)
MIANAGSLLEDYDVVLSDIWGVMHNGLVAYPGANDAMTRFRKRGGTVILVSNAPNPSHQVARTLDEKGVVRSAWDDIVSSGDLALRRVKEQAYSRVHCIGPLDRDRAFFSDLGLPDTPIAGADAVVCTGFVDDRRETVAQYRDRLEQAHARKLPFVCANPDLVVDVGTERLLCAGTLAAAYEALGGDVYWAGKPHPVSYATALQRAADLRGAATPLSRVLAIGDAVRTDLAAAAGASVDALFVAAGIHAEETMPTGVIDPIRLKTLFSAGAPAAIAAIDRLRW